MNSHLHPRIKDCWWKGLIYPLLKIHCWPLRTSCWTWEKTKDGEIQCAKWWAKKALTTGSICLFCLVNIFLFSHLRWFKSCYKCCRGFQIDHFPKPSIPLFKKLSTPVLYFMSFDYCCSLFVLSSLAPSCVWILLLAHLENEQGWRNFQ